MCEATVISWQAYEYIELLGVMYDVKNTLSGDHVCPFVFDAVSVTKLSVSFSRNLV
jgi:hypothetical protein